MEKPARLNDPGESPDVTEIERLSSRPFVRSSSLLNNFRRDWKFFRSLTPQNGFRSRVIIIEVRPCPSRPFPPLYSALTILETPFERNALASHCLAESRHAGSIDF